MLRITNNVQVKLLENGGLPRIDLLRNTDASNGTATALVKLKVDPKTVQGVLRHEDFGTTMELYAQSDMESMRDAHGKFLEQLMGDRIHLLTERVQ